MNCIFCHQNLDHSKRAGTSTIGFDCHYCNTFFMMEDEEITAIQIDFKDVFWIAIYPYHNMFVYCDGWSYSVKLPVMWVLNSNILDVIARAYNLRVFL